jgi:hypothetical protein
MKHGLENSAQVVDLPQYSEEKERSGKPANSWWATRRRHRNLLRQGKDPVAVREAGRIRKEAERRK